MLHPERVSFYFDGLGYIALLKRTRSLENLLKTKESILSASQRKYERCLRQSPLEKTTKLYTVRVSICPVQHPLPRKDHAARVSQR